MLQLSNLNKSTFLLLLIAFALFNKCFCNNCKPILSGTHYRVSQLQTSSELFLTPIKVTSTCNTPIKLNSKDRKYLVQEDNLSLGDHFFNWKNWDLSVFDGDGGVDVTGAPGGQLVEGANFVEIYIPAGKHFQMEIVIPADGYIMFDWDLTGGSTTSKAHFYVNDALIVAQQRICSPKLTPGDRIRLSLFNRSNQSEYLRVDNFRFVSNTVEVIERNWLATDTRGNQATFTQYVAIEKPILTEVSFPFDQIINTSILKKEDKIPHPSITGYPYLDYDNNSITDFDQIEIDNESVQGFETAWEDIITSERNGYKIVRQWTITDIHSKNVMQHKQVINIVTNKFTEKGIAILNDAIGLKDGNFNILEVNPFENLIDQEEE